MTQNEWKQRRQQTGMLDSKVLQDAINEYESKMCEMHTELLNCNHDLKERDKRIADLKSDYNKQIEELKEELSRKKRQADYHYETQNRTDKEIRILNSKVSHLVKFIRSKWYLRFAFGKEWLEDSKRIARGW